MENQENQALDREYKIYIPSTHQFVPVTKEVYQWADEVLKPTADLAFAGDGSFLCGEWCSFCKAKYDCRARAETIEAAYHEGEAKLKGSGKSVPPLIAIKTPLRDGDIERPDDPAYANAYFINANATTAPGIVDVDRNPILSRSEVYSGVYGRASIG